MNTHGRNGASRLGGDEQFGVFVWSLDHVKGFPRVRWSMRMFYGQPRPEKEVVGKLVVGGEEEEKDEGAVEASAGVTVPIMIPV